MSKTNKLSINFLLNNDNGKRVLSTKSNELLLPDAKKKKEKSSSSPKSNELLLSDAKKKKEKSSSSPKPILINQLLSQSKPKPSVSKKKSSSSNIEEKAKKYREKKLRIKYGEKFSLIINRVSANILTRQKYYEHLIKLLSNINNNNCINLFSNINNEPVYKIENEIILLKRIGTKSVYGVVFLAKFAAYRFAIKLLPINTSNKKEITISNNLSELTLKNECPHFAIIFKTLICNNPPISDIDNYPDLIKTSKYYIILSELASGDFKTFIIKNADNYKIIKNAIQQILISILFFHKKTNFIHDDCHWGNFLYHKIKPGGFIKYTIFGETIYIENLGYLWIIWDYGLARQLSTSYQYAYLIDYDRIINGINDYVIPELMKIPNMDNNIIKLNNVIIKCNLSQHTNENMYWGILLNTLLYNDDTYTPSKESNIIANYTIT